MKSRVSSSSLPANSTDTESWSAARHTLFLHVYSADELQMAASQSSYCKLYLGDKPVVKASRSMSSLFKSNRDNLCEHRSFHTKVCTSQVKTVALWNEKFEMPVDNIEKDILSIRVKSQLPMYSPSIGSCAIQLSQLNPGATVDQTFPLVKGEKTVGSIRLQLMIRENGGANYAKPGGQKAPKTKNSEKEKRAKDKRGKQLDDDFEAELMQREKELQFAREKKRMKEEMEQLRREEDERTRRRKQEEEDSRRRLESERRRLEIERRRLEAERLAAIEAEKQRTIDEELRRKAQKKQQKKQEKEAAARRPTKSRSSRKSTNQASDSDSDSGRSFDRNCRSGGGRRNDRSTLSLTELETVVQDALPSDSDDTDSGDEQEYIRQIAKLKLKMKAKAKAQAVMEKQQQRKHSQSVTKRSKEVSEYKPRRRKTYAASVSSSSSSSSSSSESESEDPSSSDEDNGRGKQHRSRKSTARKNGKTRDRSNQRDNTNNSTNGCLIPMEIYGGVVQSLSHKEIVEQTGDPIDIEEMISAAVTVARVMNGDISAAVTAAREMGGVVSLVGDGVEIALSVAESIS